MSGPDEQIEAEDPARAEMEALYDKLAADGIEDEAPQEAGEPEAETAEAASEPEAEAKAEPEGETGGVIPPAPSHLPAALRDKWADMTPELRKSVEDGYRQIATTNTELGRVVKAAKPVYDALVQAAKELPTLANMTPQEIARDVFTMARIQNDLNRDPAGTLLQFARQYGVVDGLRAALTGQHAPAGDASSMAAELRQLKAQISQTAQAVNPDRLRQEVQQTMTVQRIEQDVAEFAKTAPYWGEVEQAVLSVLPLVQDRMAGASHRDILAAAYDMAVNAMPETRAKVAAAKKPPAEPDPRKIEAATKAKSVNVKGTPTTAKTFTSDRAALAAKYDEIMARAR